MSTFPLISFHINPSIRFEPDTLVKQPFPLPVKMRCQATGVIDHPMAGIIAIKLGPTQYLTNQTGVFVFAD